MTWGIDLGSTSIKACRFDLGSERPKLLEERSRDCPLSKPQPGWVEHGLTCMATSFGELVESVPSGEAVSLASAMHALVLLDKRGRPLCDAISWADRRAEFQAEQLLQSDPQAWQRTGTPLHSMAWPAKLRWLAQERPDWWSRIHRVSDLKSYLWEALTGQVAPLDRSSASATGLWNLREQAWDSALCDALSLDRSTLPQVCDDYRIVWKGRTLFLGGADGPLGNLGLGAVKEGRVAVSVGTSGAVRRFRAERTEVPEGLFLYALDRLGWVEGGALSNGGSVFGWLQKEQKLPIESIEALAKEVLPGARGLLVHPYFLGERAPFWRSEIKPRVGSRTEVHDFATLARATLEGVAFCLRRLLDLVGQGTEPLRCTGGMFTSPFWCQLLADVSGREVAVSPLVQATALGAALLTEPEPLHRSRELPLGSVWTPDDRLHRVYEEIYLRWLSVDPAAMV